MSSLKHKGVGPQAMTANGLRKGPVVYMREQLDWSTDYAEALITEDEEIIAHMDEAAQLASVNNLVVGAYFIDIDADSREPVRYRERFRMNGPSFDPGRPTYAEHAKTHGATRLSES
ncbi:DUF2849 domain-containing protein [Robiginitomaculum antarcticum]|uniref:DUF2849 domain-containing protein n=1 Tax=Robiginitomaculum antarcticum TaxID=437507 RepID=UPI00036680CA|nr:DUF2849 domain-containing protein [Robiginitomaculum antarcticum]